ncbi:MAG TPA: 2OG-Fe(II) oxygenase family protein [Candidatus Saccharimonadales bacterium]|nr:2OG-Fe(II) oxygenase family protein [Candidatus Saccharimonadales bacterium]
MLKINPKVYNELETYKQSWQQDKIVVIQDLLCEEDAEKLYDYLNHVPEESWRYSLHPYIHNWYIFDNTPENQDHIKNGLESSKQAYQRGEFSYNFRRFEDYEKDDVTIKTLLKSSQFCNLIKQITNLTVTATVSVFASRYDAGSFLSCHSDGDRGQIAFVLNLTKNWKKEYGGNFELINDNWIGVKREIIPEFNTFYFFDVNNNGKPHRVTKVEEDITNNRIAFSGWMV